MLEAEEIGDASVPNMPKLKRIVFTENGKCLAPTLLDATNVMFGDQLNFSVNPYLLKSTSPTLPTLPPLPPLIRLPTPTPTSDNTHFQMQNSATLCADSPIVSSPSPRSDTSTATATECTPDLESFLQFITRGQCDQVTAGSQKPVYLENEPELSAGQRRNDCATRGAIRDEEKRKRANEAVRRCREKARLKQQEAKKICEVLTSKNEAMLLQCQSLQDELTEVRMKNQILQTLWKDVVRRSMVVQK